MVSLWLYPLSLYIFFQSGYILLSLWTKVASLLTNSTNIYLKIQKGIAHRTFFPYYIDTWYSTSMLPEYRGIISTLTLLFSILKSDKLIVHYFHLHFIFFGKKKLSCGGFLLGKTQRALKWETLGHKFSIDLIWKLASLGAR